MKRLFFSLYGLWCWLIFLSLALTATAMMAIVPRLHRRRQVVHLTARSIFNLVACPIIVEGLEHLPDGPCVVVANHASYVDGVVMQAALPPRFAYMVKREMAAVPLAAFLLRRVGTQFVDRKNPKGGATDARRVQKTASTGQSIAAFPEGTFTEKPGVGPFLGGAFAAAVKAGLPVVPAAINGARTMLPADRWLPRPARIHVRLLPAIQPPTSSDRSAVHQLRDAARAAVVAHVHEPDLKRSTEG
jgi:1-acyl-sn-glycerol-3-phosphate acyltransferase